MEYDNIFNINMSELCNVDYYFLFYLLCFLHTLPNMH